MRAYFLAFVLSFLLMTPVYAQMSGTDVHTIVDAANHGSAAAQYQLGVMLLSGKGVTKDPVKAGGWLLRSAQQGTAGAQFELAKLQLAKIAPGGQTAAYKWLILSAGNDPDRIALRDQVAALVDPQLVPVIKRQALTWKPQREELKITAPPKRYVTQ